MFLKLARKARNALYELLTFVPFPIFAKIILIVKLDAIGDYVLFRNGLEFLVKSEKYKNYKFYLLGNKLWRDLAESLDKTIIDKFIWIDPADLYNRSASKISRIKLLFKLKLTGFEIIINPVHSRILDIDFFVRDIGSRVRVASTGDDTNYQPGEKLTGDRCYTELIKVSDHSNFEFYRNREFISELTGSDPSKISLKINNAERTDNGLLVVISPGAGHIRRQWPAQYFASVIMELAKRYKGVNFYICGSASDEEKASLIMEHCTGCDIQNLTGKQNLYEFLTLLKKSSLLISNESSAIHMAAATDIPAVCISNGNMFGRFSPYPIEMGKNITVIYPDPSFYDPEQFKNNVEKTKVQSELDIAVIQPDVVSNVCIKTIDAIILNSHK